MAAVNQLGDLAACADRAELATQRLPPADPEFRRRLERARRLIAEARNRLSPVLPLHRELLRELAAR